MANLMRWDPFREMATMRELMDRSLDDSLWDAPRFWSRRMEGFPLALDVTEDADAYTVKASVPGVDPNDVEITLTDNTLTIKGEVREEQNVDESSYHVRERRFGGFTRSVTLPAAVDADKVEATHENGVLTLHLPKTEAVKPKKISVKKMIEGS